MQQQHQQQGFGYRPNLKQERLLTLTLTLGGIGCLLGALWMGSEPLELALMTLKPPLSNLVWWCGSALMLALGAVNHRQVGARKGRLLRLLVDASSLSTKDPEKGTESRLLGMDSLQWFQVRETPKGRVLELRAKDNHLLTISAQEMTSLEDFDALVNRLREVAGAEKERPLS